MDRDAITASARTPVGRAVSVALGLALFVAATHAQPLREESHGALSAAPQWTAPMPAQKQLNAGTGSAGISRFATIEMSRVPGQRPGHSLRFRFDSATNAMRGLGVAASECATLVRSSHHRSPAAAGAEGSRSFKVSLTLNCRFF